ncbi:ABC transporter ATP-binding protein [Pedobacter aquae]|uniref:ABC transporter ATP-binding protein n=1 Tax=Pedobacter aquae TaxID=2605747 RepID=A0A5C0VDZ5_9SPHI|nr:ABC transporter ATP-binding protein [Pedobacter aquae]QEK50337.1 ABC transporter ATP-binding protein [Pedobacter aquae]
MGVAIKVENLSKQYRLGKIGTGSIAHDLNKWWHTVRGKENPYLKIGETNDRSTKGNSDYVWSLKDINFEIEQGDAVGIIGRNGAGKSTLLKILSRVTGPTTGSVKVKGRIASLLEVGTGFHPELSGRENIFLNGAILGMRKYEIQSQFDEIVDFAGVERYIDTPVKRYSSGMYVRLAFAVAAHLESEILIVDEVLAVGDAEFQKKCLGKMNDVNKGEGRTVLFVSHNMAAVNTLTSNCIYLKNGILKSIDKTPKVISQYQNDGQNDNLEYLNERKDKTCIDRVFLKTTHLNNNQNINNNLEINISINIVEPLQRPAISYQIMDMNDLPLIHNLITFQDAKFGTQPGKTILTNVIKELKLYPGLYSLTLHFAESATKQKLETITNVCQFQVFQDSELRDYYWQEGSAKFIQQNDWQIKIEN